MKTLFLRYKYLILVILFSLFSVLDLTHSGIPLTDDGEYHVIRFEQFYKVLSDGILYPRWAPDLNNGFGVPLFNYVYPLPNYLAALFHFLGFNFIDSLKLNFAAASIVGAVFFYLWTKKYWGEYGAVVASVFYTFSPYHLVDIFARGSAGEVWALALFPGLGWSYLTFTQTKKKLYFILPVILLASLILAHNIQAVIFFAFFLLYALITLPKKQKPEYLKYLVFLIFLGLGLSAPFWIPAIFESQYVQGLKIFNPVNYFPKLNQLFLSGHGGGQISFEIGILNLIVVFAAAVLSFKKRDKLILTFTAVFLICIFLMTPFSKFVWDTFSFTGYIQFPWRLLSVTTLIAAFLAGSMVSPIVFKNKKLQLLTAVLLISLCFVYGSRFAKATHYREGQDDTYLNNKNFIQGTNSPRNTFNTIWLHRLPKEKANKVEVLSGDVNLKIEETKSDSLSFTADSKTNSQILVNTAYFPGWTAKVNGKEIPINNYKGQLFLNLPKGADEVQVLLNSTIIQRFSYLYFLITIFLLLYINFFRKDLFPLIKY